MTDNAMSELFANLIANNEVRKVERKKELHVGRKPTKEQQAEFVLDMLALANTHGNDPAYMLIGVENYKGTLHDISHLGLQEHSLQQFVESYIEPHLDFTYQEFEHEGVKVGLITIPHSQSRFYVAAKKIQEGQGGASKILLEEGETRIRHGSSKELPNAADYERLRDEIWSQAREEFRSQLDRERPDLTVSFVSGQLEVTTSYDMSDMQRQMVEEYEGTFGLLRAPRYHVHLGFYIQNHGNAAAENIIAEIYLPNTMPVENAFNGSIPDAKVEVRWPYRNLIDVRMLGPLLHGAREALLVQALVEVPRIDDTFQLEWWVHCRDQKVKKSGILSLHLI